jgi:hypothetical protein
VTLDLPEGWVIDPLARSRLEHQLTRRLPDHAAAVAPLTPLPAGASYRTLAEHLALQPLTACRRLPSAGPSPAGARLVRPGARAGGASVLDLGTAVHDPAAVEEDLLVAHPTGRSPFPRRPVVVLLGLDAADDVLDWARTAVNDLIERDVEARLAVTRFPPGRHLARPCLADPRSLAVLRPSVLITLDDEAAAVAEAWCPWRATTVVALDAAAPAEIVLAPWVVDAAAGRLRAALRPDASADALAALVRRLAAGPQPGPLGDLASQEHADAAPVPVPQPRRPASSRSVVLATGTLDTGGAERLAALAAGLDRRGDTVRITEATDADALGAAGLVVLRGVVADDAVLSIVQRRRERGRPTVVDLGPDDLDAVRSIAGRFAIADDVVPLVQACGLVTTPSEDWCADLRRAGLAAHRLPTPHAAVHPRPVAPPPATGWTDPMAPADPPAVGWVLDPGDLDPTGTDAIVRAVAAALGDRSDLRVLLAGDPLAWPASLASLPWVAGHTGGIEDHLGGALALVVWTPGAVRAEVAGVPGWVVRAGLHGVPVLAPRTGVGDARELLPPEVEVAAADDPAAWSGAIDHLLTDGLARAIVGAEVHRRATARTGREATDRILQDLLTWASVHAPAARTAGGPR